MRPACPYFGEIVLEGLDRLLHFLIGIFFNVGNAHAALL
jgi:hypothetical protein